jgi:hypothetical protein
MKKNCGNTMQAIATEYKRFAGLAMLGVIAWSSCAQAQSLDLQETCAAQARRSFQHAMRATLDRMEIILSRYQSHYDSKHYKCMILIEETQSVPPYFYTWFALGDTEESPTV